MNLDFAQKYASKICEELAPFCEKIEIAGSIRRQRPEVNDIDLVLIPNNISKLLARAKKTCFVKSNGDENITLITKTNIQIDLFLAHPRGRDLFNPIPSNWGTILLCRTGSKEHNIHIAQLAQRKGYHWNPYAGLADENFNLIATETESDIFSALDLDFINPEAREK